MSNPHTLVETLFREEYGKIVAILTNRYGVRALEKVEDAVQEALLKAMQVWGYQQLPVNPTAWLIRVAHNQLIDQFRKDQKKQMEATPEDLQETLPNEALIENTINDDQLRLIFACCHPKLSVEYQLVLSLKLIGGFSNAEIAKALLKKEETVAKSFTRAKKKLHQHVTNLQIPVEMGLRSRLHVVLKVIYLIFSEGYASYKEDFGIRRDFCYEAIRLALLLTKNKHCNHGNVQALLALMCFHTARFDSRLDNNNQLVTLAFQDRLKYNQELIQIGIFHLEHAGTPDRTPSSYHLQAAVAYHHSIAPSYEQTDWRSILELYDLQLKAFHSPIIALNRLIPLSKVSGSEKALAALHQLEKTYDYTNSALFFGIKATLLEELLQPNLAKDAYKTAISLTKNELEKNHLKTKMQELPI